ncbi:MAG: exo-alpha-sialidase [Pirellulales bacterium]|nr:exo-alpha-sialidase [Pirellulales bacterium]
MRLTHQDVIRCVFLTASLGLFLFLAMGAPAQSHALEFFESTVFESGTDGYDSYRIPSIIKANDGTLLAFANGHTEGGGSLDTDLVLRRSYDNGQTWDALQVVWSNGENPASNACPVVDQSTGNIFLVSNHADASEADIRLGNGTRTYQVQSSTDTGATWTDPIRIDATDWLFPRWLAGGPNHGIQLEQGVNAGRLMITGNHSTGEGFDTNLAHVIYSDDHGATWNVGAVSGYNADIYVSETAVVERVDGSLYFTTRDQNGPSVGTRAYATSSDGGGSFDGPFQIDPTAIAPVCQGSILRYSSTLAGDPANRILQSYPFSSTDRENIMVRSSFDEGTTWNSGRIIYEGSSAYSDLVRTADSRIGLLYERDSYNAITFASFTTNWLDDSTSPRLYTSMRNADVANGTLFADYGGLDGQMMGAAAQAVDPVRGNVLQIDQGAENYVSFGDVLDPMNVSYTASFWFNISDTTAVQILASKGMNYGSGDAGWAALYSTDGNLYFRANFTDDDADESNNRIALKKAFSGGDFGTWHHMVVMIDQENGLIKAYLDGVGSGASGDLDGWATAYTGNTFTPGTVFEANERGGLYDELCLGGSKSTTAMNGFLDEFAVWARALSDAEVLALYQGTFVFPSDFLPGDANNDGVVDALDAQRLAENWLSGDATWNKGDFNGDLVVNDLDASILAANWGAGVEGSSVPEPGCVALLVGLLSMAIVRRVKSR